MRIYKKVKLIAGMLALCVLTGCAAPMSGNDTVDPGSIKAELTTKASEKATEKATEENSEKASEKESDAVESTTKAITEVTTEVQTEAPTEAPTKAPAVEPALPYYIKVNRAMNCITVYGSDSNGSYTVPVKAFACSVGDYDPTNPNSEPTPLGTFAISGKYEWCLMVDGSYGRYSCRIVTDILFHSVPYLGGMVKNGLETDQYNKLGSDASLGCIRLNVRDSKWIFDNCPSGTVVEVYDDTSTPGPLGKPATIKIPLDSPYAGWDPTDDTPENPWNQFSAKIEGAKEITLEKGKGTLADVTKDVKAYDKCGNDITSQMLVEEKIDFKKAGSYDVTFSVTDATGSRAEEKIKVIVK